MEHWLILVVVLFAALLHATWNAIIKIKGDKLITMAMMIAWQGVIAIALVPLVGLPDLSMVPFLCLGALIHVGYNTFLVKAYENGHFGEVYPFARGIAPLFLLVISSLLLPINQHISVVNLVGILLLSGAIMSLIFANSSADKTVSITRQFRQKVHALRYAIITGFFISLYTLVDSFGTHQSSNGYSYIIWLFIFQTLSFSTVIYWKNPAAFKTALKHNHMVIFTAALLSFLSYGIFLWSTTQTSVAIMATVRESSVIFAAIIGAVYMKERFGGFRLIVAILVFTGLLLMAYS